MKPFVGYKKEPLSVPQLLELIPKLVIEPNYYFFRWTHKVSGIVEKTPTHDEFPMIEGQMFNHNCELRWKYKCQNTYEVLLLSIGDKHDDFIPVKETINKEEKEPWRIEPNNPPYAYPAYGYRPDTTRFPKKLIFPDTLDIRLQEEIKEEEIKEEKNNKPKLAQRYFIDNESSTVQFVALTVELAQT
ncbi:hypothetical protein BZZ01_19945 [Nostocales cyanobacterium HT-58-2]|nr:hypothetical protein BZZ01_19945 [Nostocales cyanobacterium HT-58-2]